VIFLVAPTLSLPVPLAGTVHTPASRGGSADLALAAAPSPTSHGNLQLNGSSPSEQVPAGDQIGAEYQIRIGGYPGMAPAQVYVPRLGASFSAANGTVRVQIPSVNFTVTSNLSAPQFGVGFLGLTNATSFLPGTVPALTSFGFSVMASWPYGYYTLSIRWQWMVLTVIGSLQFGPWSAWTPVVPAQLAWISSTSGGRAPPGSVYQVCLFGPIQNRRFGLQLVSTAPVETFPYPEVTVPGNASTPFCLNDTLPASLVPQNVSVYLWEYNSVSLLLYAIPLALGGHASGARSLWSIGGLLPPFLLPSVLGAAAIVAGFALMAWRARRRKGASLLPLRSRSRTISDTPASPGGPTASTPASADDEAKERRTEED
jgi:hypothetical protein